MKTIARTLVATLLSGGLAATAQAANIFVTTNADSGAGSLRQAIRTANATVAPPAARPARRNSSPRWW